MNTQIRIWKQGQFYPELGTMSIETSAAVRPGPSDDLIAIEGFNVRPDQYGHFNSALYSDEELDAVSTYGVARAVIDLYERLWEVPIKWQWQQNGDPAPLRILIRNNDINARFLPENKCIELDYYGPSENLVYNCRTIDLVAHEVGHVIMHSVKPKWENSPPETKGLEEAFCDLTPMFLILHYEALASEVIAETKGDLNRDNILSLFGVGHGFDDNRKKAIRNALNDCTYSKEEWNPYHYSSVLVGGLYELLIEMYLMLPGNDNVARLQQAGHLWMESISKTFLLCHSTESSLGEFVSILKGILPDYNEKIDQIFRRRNLEL